MKARQAKHRNGSLSADDLKRLEKAYKAGPAAFGSVSNLQKVTRLPKWKVELYLSTQNAHTKYKTPRRKFSRLKVIAFRINEIWSVDLAYVDKLAKYNRNVKYLLIAVDVLSRYLRVEPLKNKTSEETANAFKRMIRNKQPEKVWSDKGTEFKGAFQQLCNKRGIETYTTDSETKSAFAERNIRSLKNLIYKYLEKRWTWSYIDHLDAFVSTINSRVNRMTKLAPNKVTKKDTARLVALPFQQTVVAKRAKFAVGDFVRIAKQDLPFKKGYKQSFTDEIFTITNKPTSNPNTYNLIDASGEEIKGKFYEFELVKVGDLQNVTPEQQ